MGFAKQGQAQFRDAWHKGHQNLACYNSGQLTIEEFYTLGKFWRGGLRSANIHGNTRLCMATSATGLMANFGTDGPPASYVDVDQADLLCLYGHNVALMNGIIHLLIARGWVDRDFVAAHTVGFDEIEAVTHDYPPGRVAQICGIPQQQLETAAEWIGTNPLVSLPNQNRRERIMRHLFMVVQDPFIDTETVELADIYFPVAMWGEKKGCVTNADRSVNLLLKAVESPGEARNDPDGKAFLRPVHWRPHPNPVSDKYPFLLTTGRAVYHFHTRTKTARSPVLNARVRQAYVEIHPEDAARLEIATGDLVDLTSPNGRWEGVAMVVDTVRHGEVFVPFHFGHGSQAANQHTWYARDAVSQQPHFKSSPVAVRRLSFGEPQPWLLERLKELDGTSIVPFAARELDGTVNCTAPTHAA